MWIYTVVGSLYLEIYLIYLNYIFKVLLLLIFVFRDINLDTPNYNSYLINIRSWLNSHVAEMLFVNKLLIVQMKIKCFTLCYSLEEGLHIYQ